MTRTPFVETYRPFIKAARPRDDFNYGFNLRTLAQVEPLLAFAYEDWWKVDFNGLKHLPAEGPVCIASNAGGPLPWPALMLVFALMKDKEKARRLHVMVDMDSIDDERVHRFMLELGFVPWSADHAKRLFAAGQTVVMFPEGLHGATKPFKERYRPRAFDWTRLMPAVKLNIPIVPVATLGADESFPVFANMDGLAKFLDMPAFPITPFFPWLPFPFNMASLPVQWKLRMLKPLDYKFRKSDDLEGVCAQQALFLEGEIQAELNRLLRQRVRPLF